MDIQTIRFEKAMQQLEQVVQKLETGDVPLEEAIELYKQGMELSAVCHKKLQDAEKQLISIMDQDGNKTAINLDESNETDA